MGIDFGTAYKWLNSNNDFQQNYAHAKALQADYLADQIIEIADEAEGDAELRFNAEGKPYAVINGKNVQRSRLMVDARKWAASKLNPKRYGDSIDVTSGHQPLPAANAVTIEARMASIMILAQQRKAISELLED